MAKTRDGFDVKEGDIVYVFGSTGSIHETRVLPQVTDYYLFGPVEVKESFSTEKAAKEYRKKLFK